MQAEAATAGDAAGASAVLGVLGFGVGGGLDGHVARGGQACANCEVSGVAPALAAPCIRASTTTAMGVLSNSHQTSS